MKEEDFEEEHFDEQFWEYVTDDEKVNQTKKAKP